MKCDVVAEAQLDAHARLNDQAGPAICRLRLPLPEH
jgi:hypothetical protein